MAGENAKLAAARSCNSDVKNGKAGAMQDCSDVVNISVFFDGTGNNDTVDQGLHRWSNPSRLWRSAQKLANEKTFSIYVSGVGTKFNGTPKNWQKYVEVPGTVIQDKAGGDGFGAGGARRTRYGQKQVNDALRQALLDNAAKFNAETKEYAKKNSDAKLSDISKKLKPFNLIRVINLSVFGFSRGAALARAFTNDFLKKCKVSKDGSVMFNGHPVRIRFLGLFDTVASFGLPSVNIDGPFDERNLVVPDVVERCVHFVAAHELRFSFPVDLIRKGGKYRPNWKEAVYPGVHSDVGGGYEPKVQGISNNYSRIPMKHMMHEAVIGGVRMLDYDDLPAESSQLFAQLYEVSKETNTAYRDYMAAVRPSGTMEQVIAAHMKALYSGWGTMTRKKLTTPDLIEAKGSTGHAIIGHIGIAEEADLLLNPGKVKHVIKAGVVAADAPRELVQQVASVYRQYVRPESWRLEAWQANCSDAVLNFVRHNVHDSKAAFICSVEPFSYFRPRGMAESSRNVLAVGLDWLDDRAVEARNGIIKVYHRSQVVIVETWEYNKMVTKKAYKIGEKFVINTVRAGEKYAVEVYQEGKAVVISALKEGERMLVTSYMTVKKEAGEMADATQKKAGEMADATQKKAGELADAAGNKATQIGKQIKDGAGAAYDSASKAVDTGLKLIEESWKPSAYGF